MSDAQYRANKKYLAKGWRFTIDFYQHEKEMIDFIKGQENKTAYLKGLVKADMEKGQK